MRYSEDKTNAEIINTGRNEVHVRFTSPMRIKEVGKKYIFVTVEMRYVLLHQ